MKIINKNNFRNIIITWKDDILYRYVEKTIELTELLKIKYANKKEEEPEVIRKREEKINLYKQIYFDMLNRGYSTRYIYEMISDEFNDYVVSKDVTGTKSEICNLEQEFDLFFKYKALIEASKELDCLDNIVMEQINSIKSKSLTG